MKFLFLSALAQLAWSEIIIVNLKTNLTEKVFIDYELNFEAKESQIEGLVVVADPEDACGPIASPPPPSANSSFNYFALIKRRSCSLDDKIQFAFLAGYQGAIIYNVATDGSYKFSSNERIKNTTVSDNKITAVLIGNDDGVKIREDYYYSQGYLVVIIHEKGFNLSSYLLPFVAVIGGCCIAMFIVMLTKCIRDRRRARRNQLSTRQLRHLKVSKFKKGDRYEVCAVCLEEYCEGEKLRVLPCKHAYHTKCIDPWLTNNRRNCPCCKRKVAIPGVTESDSSEEEETSERTPLIQNQSGGGNNGTFSQTVSPTNVTQALMEEDSTEDESSHSNNWAESSGSSPSFQPTPNVTFAVFHGSPPVDSVNSSGSYVSTTMVPSCSHSINFEETIEAIGNESPVNRRDKFPRVV